MSEKKWVVDLSAEERDELLGLIRKGKAAARRLTRAHILLLADEGRIDEEIAAALHTNRSTAERVRHRFVEEGLEAALSERPRPGCRAGARYPWRGRAAGAGLRQPARGPHRLVDAAAGRRARAARGGRRHR